MQRGKCPKCGSDQVYKQPSQQYRGYMAISFWKSTNLTDFVCAQCGYTEAYIFDEKAKAYISAKWTKV